MDIKINKEETITINAEALRSISSAFVSLKVQVLQLEEMIRRLRLEGLKK